MASQANIYVYKLTADNGGAPCVQKGLLSLAICKPKIRYSAKVGSLVFGFGCKGYGERLIYIARVTEKTCGSRYYCDREYAGRRDRIYRCKPNGKAEIRTNARFHRDGSQLSKDVGQHFEHASVLLSSEFRYLGRKGTNDYKKHFQRIRQLIERLGIGHRVHHSSELRRDLRRLARWVWKQYPHRRRVGLPIESCHSKVCNRCGGSREIIS